jgi:hypothetical protein
VVATGSVPTSEIPDVAIVGTVVSFEEIVTVAEEGCDGVGVGVGVAAGGVPEPVHAATTVIARNNTLIAANRGKEEIRKRPNSFISPGAASLRGRALLHLYW